MMEEICTRIDGIHRGERDNGEGLHTTRCHKKVAQGGGFYIKLGRVYIKLGRVNSDKIQTERRRGTHKSDIAALEMCHHGCGQVLPAW